MLCAGRKRFNKTEEQNAYPILIEQFLEPCILLTILKEPRHGYAIMQELKDSCLCEKVDTGNFYRILSRLKKEKIIVARKDGRKSVYTITEKGEIFLTGWIDTLEKNKKVLSQFLKSYKEVSHV